MTNEVRPRLWAIVVCLAITPSTVLADGVSPVLNFFHKDTWLPASVVTLVIILVETGLLRWRLKQFSFGRALWVSVLINFASSTVGSLLLLAGGRDSYFMQNSMSLVLPLFLITLATEIPLLRLLCRQVPLSWGRACALGFGINLTSYTVVFALEIGLIVGSLSYASHLDNKELAAWQNPQLLNRLTGVIYATESKAGTQGLCVFDPPTRAWKSVTNCPIIGFDKWDLAANIGAFWENNRLVIARLPDFTILRQFPVASFVDHKFDGDADWQSVTALSLSPDAQRLAILFRYAAAVAYKDESSYYDLGSRCRLIVIDVASGNVIARAPRWASDSGLCWLPDSETVLFSSFNEVKLYETTIDKVKGSTSYIIGDADSKFVRSIFAFDTRTGNVTPFSDGYGPALALRAKRVLVRKGSTLKLLDTAGRERTRLDIPRQSHINPLISLDGTFILAVILRHNPFNSVGVGRPTLVDVSQPTVRHVLGGGFSLKYVWTETVPASANSVPVSE